MFEAAGRTTESGSTDHAERDVLAARLAVGLTHDFRNYLMGVIGFTELAAGALPDDHPARLHLRSVDALATAAADAVTRLLEITRDGGEAPRPLDLADRLRVLLRTLGRIIPPGVRLTVDAPDTLRAVAMPALIDQAVANLVLNAIDATPRSGGVIAVRLTTHCGLGTSDADVVIEVADDGPGVSPAAARHLFECEFTTEDGGYGLGLPLVEAIVSAHGGRVEVERTPGHGATFRMVVPLTAPQDDIEEAPPGVALD